jgi:hypothetical protein
LHTPTLLSIPPHFLSPYLLSLQATTVAIGCCASTSLRRSAVSTWALWLFCKQEVIPTEGAQLQASHVCPMFPRTLWGRDTKFPATYSAFQLRILFQTSSGAMSCTVRQEKCCTSTQVTHWGEFQHTGCSPAIRGPQVCSPAWYGVIPRRRAEEGRSTPRRRFATHLPAHISLQHKQHSHLPAPKIYNSWSLYLTHTIHNTHMRARFVIVFSSCKRRMSLCPSESST